MMYKFGIALRRNLSDVATRNEIQDLKYKLSKIAGGPKEIKKSIKVAFIGKANAGKSTLINRMMGMNICATSIKPQTTIEYQRVFNVKGDTEIVLLDTPGIISREKMRRYRLPKEADVFAIRPLKTVDLVGVLLDVSDKYARFMIPSEVKRLIFTLPIKTEMVLILNKVDLVKDKFLLLNCVDKVCNDLEKREDMNRHFSRIFMISALKNDGVEDLVEYIRSVAPEKNNQTSSVTLSSHSDIKIVEQKVRASLLENLRFNIPYQCPCQVDYIDENLGKIQIVATVKCPRPNITKIVSEQSVMDRIIFECEKDLTEVFGKPVFLKLNVIYKAENKKIKK